MWYLTTGALPLNNSCVLCSSNRHTRRKNTSCCSSTQGGGYRCHTHCCMPTYDLPHWTHHICIVFSYVMSCCMACTHCSAFHRSAWSQSPVTCMLCLILLTCQTFALPYTTCPSPFSPNFILPCLNLLYPTLPDLTVSYLTLHHLTLPHLSLHHLT